MWYEHKGARCRSGLSHLLGEDVLVVLDPFVPHRLEDGGERSHPDSRAHQHDHFVAEHVLTGGTKGAVDGHPETQTQEVLTQGEVAKIGGKSPFPR